MLTVRYLGRFERFIRILMKNTERIPQLASPNTGCPFSISTDNQAAGILRESAKKWDFLWAFRGEC